MRQARDDTRERLGNEHWPGEDADDPARSEDAPDGWTWHEARDQKSASLVPSDIHEEVPLTGGVSVAREKGK